MEEMPVGDIETAATDGETEVGMEIGLVMMVDENVEASVRTDEPKFLYEMVA